MTQNFIHPDQLNAYKRLKKLITGVLQLVPIERIYSSKGLKGQPFEHRLLFITRQVSKEIEVQIRPVLAQLFEDSPTVIYRFFSVHYVNQQLQQGNLFFLNHCITANLVYHDLESGMPWAYDLLDCTAIYEKVKVDFKRSHQKIKSLKKGIRFYLNRNDLPQTAFMIQQTYELAYRLLENLVMGRVKVCHSIRDHQAFVCTSLLPLKGMFDMETNEKELLGLLDDAYTKARYTHTYEITKEQINTLRYKVTLFIAEVVRVFEAELLLFREISYRLSTSTKELAQPDRNETREPKNDTLLEKIEALSKESFKKLSPILPGKDNGYFVNEMRVYSYVGLFAVLESILNVSIRALDDETDYTRSIPRIAHDVSNVLEFAKGLIPYEEGEYLDNMREIMGPFDSAQGKGC